MMKKSILSFLVLSILAITVSVSADAGLYPLPLFQNTNPTAVPGPQIPNYPQPYYQPYYQPDYQPYYPQPNQQPYYPQPAPQYQPNYASYPQVSLGWNNDGSYRLTWTIKNTTNGGWSSSDVDIKCVSGCELLRDQSRMRWDIPYTVERNRDLTFSVDINRPYYSGYRMTFSLLNGGDQLYMFDVYI